MNKYKTGQLREILYVLWPFKFYFILVIFRILILPISWNITILASFFVSQKLVDVRNTIHYEMGTLLLEKKII